MSKSKKFSGELDKVSEEHYDLLMFGLKLAEGLRNNIEITRLKAYADWFYQNYLLPHIQIEKEYIFPILGLDNVRIKRALANHRRLQRLFTDEEDVFRTLNLIEEEIGRFVRFEERVLMKQIEKTATEEQLEEIKKRHGELNFSEDEWEDKFWEEE